MPRLSMLMFALVLTATGCETGSTHINQPDSGVSGQNVGQGSDKSGPVPGSSTGTDATSYALPETAPMQPAPNPTPASSAQQPEPSSKQKEKASSTPVR